MGPSVATSAIRSRLAIMLSEVSQPARTTLLQISMEHGTVRLEHGTVRLEHRAVRLEHGTVRLEHGTLKLEHGTVRLESRRELP